jgi:hypothetical protein
LSQDQPTSPDQRPPGGRPPGSPGRRRRRGRGRGGPGGGGTGGVGGANATPAATPAVAGAPRPNSGGSRSSRGSSRGSDRRGGSGGERGGGRRQPQPQAQPAAVRELEITDDKIFQRLLDSGFDLGQEAVIEAFLYFSGEGPARRVAAQLDEGGYQTYVDPSPPGRWLLEAVSRAVPTPEHIASMGTSLRNAARSNNGTYDGWWASEPPEEDEAGLVGVALEEDPERGQEDDLQVQPE